MDVPEAHEPILIPEEVGNVSTWSSLHFHWICSTKDRMRLIRGDWRARFHEYLGGTVRELDGVPLEVGGVEDHVHLLVGLKPSHHLSDFSRELKKTTSVWATQHGDADFQWQEGYAVFAVSVSMIETVRRYIQGQESHHRRRSFHDELEAILARHGIEVEPGSSDGPESHPARVAPHPTRRVGRR